MGFATLSPPPPPRTTDLPDREYRAWVPHVFVHDFGAIETERGGLQQPGTCCARTSRQRFTDRTENPKSPKTEIFRFPHARVGSFAFRRLSRLKKKSTPNDDDPKLLVKTWPKSEI